MPEQHDPTITVRVTPRAGVFVAVAHDVVSGAIVRRDRALPDVARLDALRALLAPALQEVHCALGA